MNYCAAWKSLPGTDITIDEIPGARHHEVLIDPKLQELIIKYLCFQPTKETIGKSVLPAFFSPPNFWTLLFTFPFFSRGPAPGTENLEYEDSTDTLMRTTREIGQKLTKGVSDFFGKSQMALPVTGAPTTAPTTTPTPKEIAPRSSVFIESDVPRARSLSVEYSKDKPKKEKGKIPPLAGFFTSVNPSVDFDTNAKRAVAAVHTFIYFFYLQGC